jgi:hypothetical protein
MMKEVCKSAGFYLLICGIAVDIAVEIAVASTLKSR